MRQSGDGRAVDAVDCLLEDGVEFIVALREAQILREGAREAGDEAVVAGELFVRIVHGVAAAECDDADDVAVLHDLCVEVVDGRDGDLEHDLGIGGQFCEVLLHAAEHDLLCLCFVGAVDVDLGLEDGDEPLADDLHADLELLVDDGADAVGVRLFDDGAHLCAEDVTLVRAVKQRVKPRDGLHQLNAVFLVRESLVHLEDGDNALLVPEKICREEAVDLAIHGVLKENCREDLVLVERGALDDAGAHLVNAREHLLLAVVGTLVDAVRLECLRRGAAALVECRDKALVMLHAPELFLIHWAYLLVCEHMREGKTPLLDSDLIITQLRSEINYYKRIYQK